MTARRRSEARADTGRTTGLSPRVGGVLAYLGWWITGGLLLVLERRDAFIRFHAAQSFVALGAIWLAGLVVHGTAFLMLSLGARAFVALLWLSYAVWAVGVGVWAFALVVAARGERWRVPFAARAADRISRTS